jgi:hypothetical protein
MAASLRYSFTPKAFSRGSETTTLSDIPARLLKASWSLGDVTAIEFYQDHVHTCLLWRASRRMEIVSSLIIFESAKDFGGSKLLSKGEGKGCLTFFY